MRWRVFSHDLLNDKEEAEWQVTRENDIEILEPTQKEVDEILNKMKNNEYSRGNGITIENTKYGAVKLK